MYKHSRLKKSIQSCFGKQIKKNGKWRISWFNYIHLLYNTINLKIKTILIDDDPKHLDQIKNLIGDNKDIKLIKCFKNPILALQFLKKNLVLVGSTGDNMKNEQYVPKQEIQRLKLTLEEFEYLNKVASHRETTGITDEEIEKAISFSQLKGISRDVGLEERITEKDKNQFKRNS